MESVALKRGWGEVIGCRRRNAVKTEIGLTQLGCSLKMRVLGGLLLLIDELHLLGAGRCPCFPFGTVWWFRHCSSALLYVQPHVKDNRHAFKKFYTRVLFKCLLDAHPYSLPNAVAKTVSQMTPAILHSRCLSTASV